MENFVSESWLHAAVFLLVPLVEAGGALVIFGGALLGFFRFIVQVIRTRRAETFTPVRLDIGRFLALGL